jgi:hypothetical protein
MFHIVTSVKAVRIQSLLRELEKLRKESIQTIEWCVEDAQWFSKHEKPFDAIKYWSKYLKVKHVITSCQ